MVTVKLFIQFLKTLPFMKPKTIDILNFKVRLYSLGDLWISVYFSFWLIFFINIDRYKLETLGVAVKLELANTKCIIQTKLLKYFILKRNFVILFFQLSVRRTRKLFILKSFFFWFHNTFAFVNVTKTTRYNPKKENKIK